MYWSKWCDEVTDSIFEAKNVEYNLTITIKMAKESIVILFLDTTIAYCNEKR